MQILTLKINEEDVKLLKKIMKGNSYKNKSVAIRECIRRCAGESDYIDVVFEVNSKLNRLIHNVYLVKNLLEQMFVNFQFDENLDLKNDECFNEFMKKNNKYTNAF